MQCIALSHIWVLQDRRVLPSASFPLLTHCTKSGWGVCGNFYIPDSLKYSLLLLPFPKSYMDNLERNLGNLFVFTSTCWNKEFPQTVAANDLLVLSPFFWFCYLLKVFAFKLPRFVCLFLGTMFWARALLFNWTMGFPHQWSTWHIPHLLRSLKEFKQTLWGLDSCCYIGQILRTGWVHSNAGHHMLPNV